MSDPSGIQIEKILSGSVRLIKKQNMKKAVARGQSTKKRGASDEPTEEDTYLGGDSEDDFESIGTSDSESDDEGNDDGSEALLESDASDPDTDPDCSYDEGMETDTSGDDDDEEEIECTKSVNVIELSSSENDQPPNELDEKTLVPMFRHALVFGNMIKSGDDFLKVRKALAEEKNAENESISNSLKTIETNVCTDIDSLCNRLQSKGGETAADMLRYTSECWGIRWKKVDNVRTEAKAKCAITGESLASKRSAVVELDINLRKLYIRESTAAVLRGDEPILWDAWRDKKETQLKSANPVADTFFADDANEIQTKTTRLTRTFIVKACMIHPIRAIMSYGLFADHANPHLLTNSAEDNARTFLTLKNEVNAY